VLSAGVKICGLRTCRSIDAAIGAGATHYGLVFFAKSPRNVTLEEAANLAGYGRGRILSVALTVNATDDLLDSIARTVRPDMLQLHGTETPERTAQIRELTGLPVIKAVSVGAMEDTAMAKPYENITDLILFDAKPPRDGDSLPGGNGLPFDWHHLAPVREKMRFMLSGGLTPDNVAEAIRLTGAGLVDVSSGVENAPGVKDPELIRRFVEAARNTAFEEIAHG
jgi:phosphoribosylanthranilate isomerase